MILGTAPDSWGVWFADDPHQMPWRRFLDEVQAAGYSWIELGPFGYLPTERSTLSRELDRRGLRLTAGGTMFPLERQHEFEAREQEIRSLCQFLAAFDARYLMVIDDTYTDLRKGDQVAPTTLEARAWGRLVETVERVAELAHAHDLELVFHPHAQTHVETEDQIERLFDDTPESVGLCLDVGHHAYVGGDPVTFLRQHAGRIRYLHLKSIDIAVRDRVVTEGVSFARAVAMGVFVEPSAGEVDFVAFREALTDIGYEGFGIVEQDMYPAPPERPLPIARRTRAYFREIGLE